MQLNKFFIFGALGSFAFLMLTKKKAAAVDTRSDIVKLKDNAGNAINAMAQAGEGIKNLFKVFQ